MVSDSYISKSETVTDIKGRILAAIEGPTPLYDGWDALRDAILDDLGERIPVLYNQSRCEKNGRDLFAAAAQSIKDRVKQQTVSRISERTLQAVREGGRVGVPRDELEDAVRERHALELGMFQEFFPDEGGLNPLIDSALSKIAVKVEQTEIETIPGKYLTVVRNRRTPEPAAQATTRSTDQETHRDVSDERTRPKTPLS